VSWFTVVAAVAAALLGTGGGAAIITALARRNVMKVEVAAKLNETALEYVEQVRTDTRADVVAARAEAHEARTEASEARKEAAKARDEATSVRREMRTIKTEAIELTSYLGQIVRWIQSPDMDMDRLRELVSRAGSVNGTMWRLGEPT